MARSRSPCRRSFRRLCICIVFVPMFFLTGVAKFLFVPLAEAVVFAMLASYFLSRTLIPTLVMYIMRGHEHRARRPKSILRPLSAWLRTQVRTISATATTSFWKLRSSIASCSPLCFLLFACFRWGSFSSWARTSSRRSTPA